MKASDYKKLDRVCSICGYRNNCVSHLGNAQWQRRIKRRRMKQMLYKQSKEIDDE